MIEVCPHCGASLPVTRDAYCSECRGPLAETTHLPLLAPKARMGFRFERGRYASEYFTIPGRILVLVSLVLAVGGPWIVLIWLYDSLTPGRYPLWFFALPIWIGVVLLFALAAAVLKWLGIPIFQQLQQPDGGGGSSEITPGACNDA